MQDRSRDHTRIAHLSANSFEAVLESSHKRRPGRASVASVYDTGGLVHVDLGRLDERLDGLDEVLCRSSVRKGGRMAFPSGLKHIAAGIDELDTVVLFRDQRFLT